MLYRYLSLSPVCERLNWITKISSIADTLSRTLSPAIHLFEPAHFYNSLVSFKIIKHFASKYS